MVRSKMCAVSSLEEFRCAIATRRPRPRLVLLVDLFAIGDDFCVDAGDVSYAFDVPLLCFCNGPGMPINADMESMSVADVVETARSYHETALRNEADNPTIFIAVRFPSSLNGSVVAKVREELSSMGAPLAC